MSPIGWAMPTLPTSILSIRKQAKIRLLLSINFIYRFNKKEYLLLLLCLAYYELVRTTNAKSALGYLQ
jgi:hypothetical protein